MVNDHDNKIMGLFGKKKKKAEISLTISNSFEDQVNKLYKETEQQIQEGLAKTTASTGTPISELSGAAKDIAQLSNIGGGSKATGGGGMAKGFDTVTKHNKAATVKKMIDASKKEQKKIDKKK